MKKEWDAFKTLLVSAVIGVGLVILMFGIDNTEQKEYLRDETLNDGNESDWHDKLASVLYSPGELHSAHFKSEINCQHCHIPGERVSSDYCITCHSKKDFKNNTTSEILTDTHLFIMDEMTCFNCHSEHRGLGGNISISLDLEGHKTHLIKSVREECVECHQSDQKQAHPNMKNNQCIDCHKLEQPFSFHTNNFVHTDVEELKINKNSLDFIKLPFPSNGECEDCHKPNFHVGEKGFDRSSPPQIEGEFDCLSCHNFTTIQGGSS